MRYNTHTEVEAGTRDRSFRSSNILVGPHWGPEDSDFIGYSYIYISVNMQFDLVGSASKQNFLSDLGVR